jgi:hypothetical protein
MYGGFAAANVISKRQAAAPVVDWYNRAVQRFQQWFGIVVADGYYGYL